MCYKKDLFYEKDFQILLRLSKPLKPKHIDYWCHTLKRRSFHVLVQAAIMKKMIAVHTFNKVMVCGICNSFLAIKLTQACGKPFMGLSWFSICPKNVQISYNQSLLSVPMIVCAFDCVDSRMEKGTPTTVSRIIVSAKTARNSTTLR